MSRKPPTKAQQAYQDQARATGCVVCRFRLENRMQQAGQCGPTEIHHRNLDDKHGQKQLGQDAVVALGAYHHRGAPWWGHGDAEMRAEYGPSFALHPREFREWTADVLPELTGRGTERWQQWYDNQGSNHA